MNQKGQVLMEAAMILAITIAGLFLLLKKGMQIPLDFYLDDLIEKVLICEYQKQLDCKARLQQKLRKFHFQNIVIQSNSLQNEKSVSIIAQSPFGFKINKESFLKLNLTNL